MLPVMYKIKHWNLLFCYSLVKAIELKEWLLQN